MNIIEELNQLEHFIERCRRDYDMFFAGHQKHPPWDIQRKVEAIINRLSDKKLNNPQASFRLRNLVGRFGMYNQLWARKNREREEGIAIGRPVARRSEKLVEAPPPPPPPPEPVEAPPRTAEPVTAEPSAPPTAAKSKPDSVAKLFDRYVSARQDTGEGTNVDIEAFRQLVMKQAKKIQEQLGCKSVTFRVTVEDGKAKLKAVGRN
ncbi:MAG: hypothetical protein HYV63_22030 [Candidatus Schekmanbacteria bacterium]|nr:hypothetical protein [Candidatus Schekmanbacteria bacterium]